MSKLKKELKRFLVAGISAVITDFIAYYILLDYYSHDISKALSFLSGTLTAYIMNKYWTFEKYKKSFREIAKFGILYTITLWINVLTNKKVLDNTEFVFLAFLAATGVSTILNFIGQKWWIFR